jgi:hypothetical protein
LTIDRGGRGGSKKASPPPKKKRQAIASDDDDEEEEDDDMVNISRQLTSFKRSWRHGAQCPCGALKSDQR